MRNLCYEEYSINHEMYKIRVFITILYTLLTVIEFFFLTFEEL